MRLYHFTTEWHWRRIQHAGFLKTVDSNAAMYDEHAAPDVVWFTDQPDPADQWEWVRGAGGDADKRLAVRIAVDTPDAEPWLSWLERYVTPDDVFIDGLGGREAAAHWYVVPRPVLEAEWAEVEILVPPRTERSGDHFMVAELARWEAIGNGMHAPPNLDLAVRYDSLNGVRQHALTHDDPLIDGNYRTQWNGLAPYVERAETYFVTAPMSTLIDEASLSVPDYAVQESDFLSRDSFVYLAEPWLIPTGVRQFTMHGAPVTQGRVLVISAFSVHVEPGAPKAIVAIYTRDRDRNAPGMRAMNEKSAFATEVPGTLSYAGVATFPIGAPWRATIDAKPLKPLRTQLHPEVDGALFSADLFAHVAAFATVINQRLTSRARRQIPRVPRRNLQRKGHEPGDVQVITLRAHDYKYDDAQYLGEMAGRYLSVRFIVRGHWRNQPYGEDRAQRRKQWIASFIKGPDDAPLRLHADRLFDVSR